MTYALITNLSQAIIWVVPTMPNPFVIPDGTQVFGASAGWTNGTYTLVSVPPFVTPNGQVNTGSPIYSVSDGVVTESYATQAAPVIPSSTYVNALASGLAITSTSTPAINGTYDISAGATANLNAVETYILANGTFPLGSTQPWFLLNGTEVVVPSVAVFKEIAAAVAQYVAGLDVENAIAIAGGTPTWPSAAVTIA
jgi:hypothetical protein